MSKHVAFAFGRFNPPTLGHFALINKTVESAKNGDFYIFTGQTQDKDKNPLSYGDKISFMRLLFPTIASHIIQDEKIKTVLNAADWLEAKGYTDATFVCGSDRIEEFTKLLNKWNEIHNGQGKGFTTLNIVSSGEREEGAEGVAGISASKARELARQGNYVEFVKIVPNDEKLAGQIFNALRAAMGGNVVGSLDTFTDKKAERAARKKLKEIIKSLVRQIINEDTASDVEKAKKDWASKEAILRDKEVRDLQAKRKAKQVEADNAENNEAEAKAREAITSLDTQINTKKKELQAAKAKKVT